MTPWLLAPIAFILIGALWIVSMARAASRVPLPDDEPLRLAPSLEPLPLALLEIHPTEPLLVTPRGVELDLDGTAWGISDVADVIATIESL